MEPGRECDTLVTVSQWKEFWKCLLSKASGHDAWWLDSWLERRLREYIEDILIEGEG